MDAKYFNKLCANSNIISEHTTKMYRGKVLRGLHDREKYNL